MTKTDIPCQYNNGKVHMTSLIRIKLLKRCQSDQFTFGLLGKEYGIHAVRGPRGIPGRSSETLKQS